MPIDSHVYLSRQGWAGKGSGLRDGAISRPLHVSQKKTLSGVGKDRDEAFPFWDHVFTAAAKSIVIKVPKGDDSSDSESDAPTPPAPALARTVTGILSNRRPTLGTPAYSASASGSSTPLSSDAAPKQMLSLLAMAKQQAARSALYSRFYRGPVLRMEDDVMVEVIASASTSGALPAEGIVIGSEMEVEVELASKTKKRKRERADEGTKAEDVSVMKAKKKKKRTAVLSDAPESGVTTVTQELSVYAIDLTPIPAENTELSALDMEKKKKKKKKNRRDDASVALGDADDERTLEKKKRKKERQEHRLAGSVELASAAASNDMVDDTLVEKRKKKKRKAVS